jgi:hypothetical protein
MANLSRKLVMISFVLVVLGLLLVEPTIAPVTVPADPMVAPEIVSVVVNHNPVWFPPTYTTNPYTGEVTETSSGRYLQTGTIDVTIKNMPFTPYTDKDGNYINVYYTFFIKDGGPIDDWNYYLDNYGGNSGVPWHVVYQQSDSDYTVITFTYDGSGSLAPGFFTVIGSGSIRSFRVQSVIGYFYRNNENPYYNSVYEGEGSEWTQFTVTIPVSDKPVTSTSNVPSNTGSPSNSNSNNPQSQQNTIQPYLTIILVSVCIIALLLIVIAYLLYKQRKNKTNSTQLNPTTIGTT